MKLKSLLIIVAGLAALSAVVYFARRPAPSLAADARIGQPILDAATAERVAEIRFADAGKSIVLKRDAAGTWRVPAYFDFPADFPKVARFVGELSEANLTRLVTTSPERIARLEFKDTQVTLLDSSAKEIWSVTLGKTPETGTGRFIKFGSEAKAYLATLASYLDTEPKSWAATELLALKPDDIAKIEIPFAEGGPVTFTRAKKEDPWTASPTPDGQKLKADALAPALNTLTGLRFSETTEVTDAKAVATKAHERQFTVETFDNKIVKIALGRTPEEKKIKPPVADAMAGLAALGTAADLAKSESTGKPAEPAKPIAPEFETIPAGPVFVAITSGDPTAVINALMQKRAFQVAEFTFTSLPQKSADLFEPAAGK